MSHFINKIRFYHYMSGVLVNQQSDPLCSKCKPFVNTVAAMRKDMDEIKNGYAEDPGSLPEEILALIEKAETRVASINIPEYTQGQKKAGNCRMPKGVCLVKSSKALLKTITEEGK